MDQRISFVTLAVRDLGSSRSFYVDGLGWEPAVDEPGAFGMAQRGSLMQTSARAGMSPTVATGQG